MIHLVCARVLLQFLVSVKCEVQDTSDSLSSKTVNSTFFNVVSLSAQSYNMIAVTYYFLPREKGKKNPLFHKKRP